MESNSVQITPVSPATGVSASQVLAAMFATTDIFSREMLEKLTKAGLEPPLLGGLNNEQLERLNRLLEIYY